MVDWPDHLFDENGNLRKDLYPWPRQVIGWLVFILAFCLAVLMARCA